MIDRPEVLHHLALQHWVASVDQLLDLGLSAGTIKRARRAGALTQVVRGVVRLTASPDTFESRAIALQLLVGDGSFVSGFSAGVLYGLREMPRRPIEVSVAEVRQVHMPPWGRLVRTSWIDPARDVWHRDDGLRVASPLRTLFGLARTFNDFRFERAAEDAWHRQLVTPESATDYLAAIRRSGRSGVKRMERWLEKTSFRERPSHTGLELTVLAAIRRAGLPEAERQYPLTLRSGELIHLDFAWPVIKLAVEPGHSWWHGGDLKQRADQSRDRACLELGWLVVRHDESLRDDPAAFGRQLRIIYDERMRSLHPD